MARTDLSSLLDKIDTDEVAVPQQPAVEGTTETEPAPVVSPTPAAAQPRKQERKQVTSGATKKRPPLEPASAAPQSVEPLYLRLVRKETRLREEQYETLTEYARKLNRAKTAGAGERITENTLIRIAIDLLIPHLGDMQGNDESQLRDSVSNGV